MADASLPDRAKRCARCGELKAASEFYPARHRKDGLHQYCARCIAAWKRERREQGLARKRCSQCGAVKYLDEFVREKANRDGHRSWCIECYRPYNAAKEAARRQMAERAICACGCGEQVKYPGAKYRHGHRCAASADRLLSVKHSPVLRSDTDGTDRPKKYERRERRTHKRCTACCEVKPIAEFDQYPFITKLGKQGKACFSRCKPCARENVRARRRKLSADDKVQLKAYQRAYQLLKDYGLTAEQFEELKAKQEYRCSICKRKGRLGVDHCHKTGRVRELLCANCNNALGLVHEDESIIRRLLEYVQRHRAGATG